MASFNDVIKETVYTNSSCYKKELKWEIENFKDWWSSREIEESQRMESRCSTMEEELQIEVPENWTKATTSPIIKFEIEGVEHEFKLAILKYDSYDRFDDDHNLMMGISLYYNGPFEKIIIKPLFYTKESGKEYGAPLQAQQLEKGTYSNARVFSHHSLTSSKLSHLWQERFIVMCLVQVNIFKDFSDIHKLENSVANEKTWTQCLSDNFDFANARPDIDQFSDFEIICTNKSSEKDEEVEHRFRCHKLVLFLGSEYYKKMFSGNFTENKGTVTVTDVSSHTMANILKYLYTGALNKSEMDVELLMAADKYEIGHLKAICELELGTKITIETALELASVATLCGSNIFKRHVLDFIRKHWKHLDAKKRFDWTKENPHILSEVLHT